MKFKTLLILFICLNINIYSQKKDSGKLIEYKIKEIKGDIKINSKFVKKDTIIKAPNTKAVRDKLEFSSKTDYVKIYNIADNSQAQMIYALQQIYNPENNLRAYRSRGLMNEMDLNEYFSKPYIIIDADTLLNSGSSYKTDKQHSIILSFIYKNKEYNISINHNDTIIINKSIFVIKDNENKALKINSLEISQVSLIYYDKKDFHNTYISKNINLISIEDYIKFLNDNGLNQNQIMEELLTYCINLDNIKEKFNFNDTKAKEWLKNKISASIKL